MTEKSTVWGWAPYREGGVWHAYRPDRASWCGLLHMDRDAPLREPGGRKCKHCLRRLERGAPAPPQQWSARCPGRLGPRCGCPKCRAHRARHARELVREWVPGVCRCVREWPGAREFVEEIERRALSLLLTWEMAGGSAEARDVEDALRALRAAWRDAAAQYEIVDGTHPHREAER